MIHLGCQFCYHTAFTKLIFQDNADLGKTPRFIEWLGLEATLKTI